MRLDQWFTYAALLCVGDVILPDVELTREDWDRVLQALSYLRHNPKFKETYDKVAARLCPDSE